MKCFMGKESSHGQWCQVKTGKYGPIVATLKGWLNFLKHQNISGSGHCGKRSPTLYIIKKGKSTLKNPYLIKCILYGLNLSGCLRGI